MKIIAHICMFNSNRNRGSGVGVDRLRYFFHLSPLSNPWLSVIIILTIFNSLCEYILYLKYKKKIKGTFFCSK